MAHPISRFPVPEINTFYLMGRVPRDKR